MKISYYYLYYLIIFLFRYGAGDGYVYGRSRVGGRAGYYGGSNLFRGNYGNYRGPYSGGAYGRFRYGGW